MLPCPLQIQLSLCVSFGPVGRLQPSLLLWERIEGASNRKGLQAKHCSSDTIGSCDAVQRAVEFTVTCSWFIRISKSTILPRIGEIGASRRVLIKSRLIDNETRANWRGNKIGQNGTHSNNLKKKRKNSNWRYNNHILRNGNCSSFTCKGEVVSFAAVKSETFVFDRLSLPDYKSTLILPFTHILRKYWSRYRLSGFCLVCLIDLSFKNIFFLNSDVHLSQMPKTYSNSK